MSFVNQKPPNAIRIAQAVGITASAMLAGTNMALSVFAIPAIMQGPAPLAARQWRQIYDLGKKVGPGLAAIGTATLAYVAYQEDPTSFPFKLNVAACLMLPSIVPYTLVVMAPTNKGLYSKASSLASTDLSDKSAETSIEREETVHALLDKWATLNLGRALVTLVGTAAAMWAAVN
ncbi:hypothetical protein GQ43DRAFT_441288 [Delitschia confertaspora ATCC 74209]|uniref:DUF1772-domain-containing protein n=1 Tax=Delitschia confertaspora ATCC 74209 TaxID=1513339 RepID=A0A9P4JM12_9PLEO|nr:hypothetical protein GQ43DRAFT_441288 [Delitschia confertaspora ATCC 74209]